MECGSNMKEDEQFCPSCGKKYNEIEQDSERTLHTATPITKRKMTLRNKVALFVSIFLIIVIISSHLVIQSMVEPEKTILPIYNSLLNENEESFYKHVVIADKVEYDAESYMSYIKAQNMDQFLGDLKESSSEVIHDGLTRIIQHEDGSELFRITQKKFLLFYPTIEIQAIHTSVNLETDIQESTLTFNEKEYKLDGKPMQLGSYLPGTYVVKGTSNNSITPNSADWEMSVSTAEKLNTLYLMNKDLMISLNGEQPDSIVYVNGVSTKKTITELKQIGPIFGDTKLLLTAEKETPTGELAKSYEEVAVRGDTVHLNYPAEYSFVIKTPEQLAEEKFNRDDLEEFILGFRNSYESSLNNKDFSIVQQYLEPDTEAYVETVEFIGDIGDEYYHYNFIINEVTSIELSVDEANVFTYEEFEFTNHLNEVVLYEREKQYDIRINDGGEFKIHKIHIGNTKRTR